MSLETDKAILMQFFESTKGESWTNKEKWGSDAPVGEWFGITVENDRVTKIVLPSNNLAGTIPVSVEELGALESFEVQNNSIEGELPSKIGDLSKLKTLDVSSNNITGEIPKSVGELKDLETLNASDNQISGKTC